MQQDTQLGQVFLPTNPGTHVGRFEFIVSREAGGDVEIGTPVTAETSEGESVGIVVDMRTVGTQNDPVAADLAGSQIARLGEAVVAEVQVLSSPRMRPVRSGSVRAATADEIRRATGEDRMSIPVPAGVVPLADGSYTPVSLDLEYLLGPQAGHLLVGGLSGMAAKTSYLGVLMASALARSDANHRVAALVFNVKGEDLIHLDKEVEPGMEPDADDLAIYAALGIEPKPFRDVTVYAPSLGAGSTATHSPRTDALALGWDLRQIWPYLRHLLGNIIYEDEKLATLLNEFRTFHLDAHQAGERIDTFDQLERWFDEHLRRAEAEETQQAWRSHHKATMWRARRMLMGLPTRSGGLLVRGKGRPETDVPAEGWRDGQVVVVDIAGLNPITQSAAVARTVERMLESAENGTLGVDHLIVVADELNAFAPAQGGDMATVKKILQRVSTQGRYAGISLWGAGQKLSKVDEMIRDNAASRALGVNTESELSSGAYGRMPGGLAERVATLPKGQMLLSHHSYRSPIVVAFPRPAWRTGRSRTTGGTRPKQTSVLPYREEGVERATEGVPDEVVEAVISRAGSADEAAAELARLRQPDMHRTAVHEPSAFDPENPFDLE